MKKKLTKQNIEDIFALTPMQEGMLFHYLKDPNSDLYFEQLSLDISGEVEREIFEKAWQFVIESNEMLRTVFRWENVDNPIQIILKENKLQPVYWGFSEQDALERDKLEEVRSNDKKRKFDLREVPFRVTLCKIEEDKYEMIISNHHILYDGWSNGIILREFFKVYDDLAHEKELVKTVKMKFKEFVKWNQDQDIEKQEKFWKDYLKGFDTQTGISIKRKRKEITTPITDTFKVSFSRDLKNKIEDFVKSHKITLASLLYSAWGILLQKYNSNNDILFDTTISGRNIKIKGIEEAVGLFINSLPLRVQTYHHEKILDFLWRTNEMVQQWKAFAGGSPLNMKEYLDEGYGENLFNSVLVIENYPLNKALMQDISTSILKVNGFSISERTYHDLTIIITTFDDMMIHLTYNPELFDEGMVKTLAEHFTLILRKMVENTGQNVSVLEISPGEIREIRECIINKYTVSPSPSPAEYYAPRHPLEKELLDIWSRVFRVGKKEIGIDTNFLDLGGHSLKAAALRSMIHKRLKVRVPFAQFFKCLTIREQAAFIRELKETRYIPLQAVEKKEYYELSSAQKRFYILHMMDKENATFNMPNVYQLEGNLDKRKLEKAFKIMLCRYESLRTSFHVYKGETWQKVEENVDFKVEYSQCSEAGINEKIRELIHPFQLDRAPLFRVHLIRVEEEKHFLLLDIHHIAADGASIEILLEDFTLLYQGKRLESLTIQYKDYAAWHNICLKKKKLTKEENYWIKQLKGLTFTRVPVDTTRSYHMVTGKYEHLEIPQTLYHKVNEFCSKHQVTKFIFLITIFFIVVEMEIDQQDITIGTPLMNRDHKDLHHLIGVFLNVLLIRSTINKNDTFLDYLEASKKNIIEALENSSYPYEWLVARVKERNNWKRDELFTILFNYFVIEKKMDQLSGGLKMHRVNFQTVLPKYDLTLYVTEDQELVHLDLVYKANLFSEHRIKRILEHFLDVVEIVLENQKAKLCDLSMDNDSVLGELDPGMEFYENDEFL
ncbi:MAG: hypothetical protein JSV88_27370 [Candidatus Aminicenantes bacterium]|nr:MAG: hypothetical protein JSV88_27370 [Candidatus Aminicenantes bacterium]